MTRTAVVFSPMYYLHNPGRNHPESANRLRAIVNRLEEYRLSGNGNWRFVEAEKASLEDIEQIHCREYVRLVEAVCKSGGGPLDLQDTVASPESFEVALCAVGGALKAVNLVMNRDFENSFALVRPPGHHARRFHACGFCIFNNVAITASYLIRKFLLKRILILDIDAHHGNGTQEAFYKTNKVLYVSLHEDPRDFPGTGFADETGKGAGVGYNVNIPLPYGTADQIYLKAIKEVVVPIVRQYKPEFILSSAGFDGHYADPIGKLSLSAQCVEQVYETMMNLASELCQGRFAAVLEGGYDPRSVGNLAADVIRIMSGTPRTTRHEFPRTNQSIEARGARIIEKVKGIQRDFWILD